MMGRLELFVVGVAGESEGVGVAEAELELFGAGDAESPVAPGLKVAVVTGSGIKFVSMSSIDEADVSPAADCLLYTSPSPRDS